MIFSHVPVLYYVIEYFYDSVSSYQQFPNGHRRALFLTLAVYGINRHGICVVRLCCRQHCSFMLNTVRHG